MGIFKPSLDGGFDLGIYGCGKTIENSGILFNKDTIRLIHGTPKAKNYTKMGQSTRTARIDSMFLVGEAMVVSVPNFWMYLITCCETWYSPTA